MISASRSAHHCVLSPQRFYEPLVIVRTMHMSYRYCLGDCMASVNINFSRVSFTLAAKRTFYWSEHVFYEVRLNMLAAENCREHALKAIQNNRYE